jgi:hypothetical protein
MTLALDRPWVRSLATVSVGLGVALALPFLVHLLPATSGPPAGARLLPIFFASLVLVLRGAPLAALAVAAMAPLLNRIVTGMPAGPMLPTLLLELTVFTALLIVAVRLAPRIAPFLAPVAYLVAATLAGSVLASSAVSLDVLVSTVSISWPGLVMLLAVGALAGRGREGARARA